MKDKFWLCKRGKDFYSCDSETGERKSLGTADREQANQLIRAKNDAVRPPSVNLAIAKAYLAAADPKLIERTWSLVMAEFCSVGKETTRLRRRRGIKSPVFNLIRNKKLIETTGDDFREMLRKGGAFTQHTLRCFHNLALNMGWLLAPIIPPKLWPKIVKQPKRAITAEEHQRIIQNENNPERKSDDQNCAERHRAPT